MKKIIYFLLIGLFLTACDKENQIVEEDLNGFSFYEGQELTEEQAKAIGLPEFPGGYVMSGDIIEEPSAGRSAPSILTIIYPVGSYLVEYFRTTSGGSYGSWAFVGQKTGDVHVFSLPTTTHSNCTINGGTPMQWWCSQVISGQEKNNVHIQYYDGTQGCNTPVVAGALNTDWNIHPFGVFPGGLTTQCSVVRSYTGNCN